MIKRKGFFLSKSLRRRLLIQGEHTVSSFSYKVTRVIKMVLGRSTHTTDSSDHHPSTQWQGNTGQKQHATTPLDLQKCVMKCSLHQTQCIVVRFWLPPAYSPECCSYDGDRPLNKTPPALTVPAEEEIHQDNSVWLYCHSWQHFCNKTEAWHMTQTTTRVWTQQLTKKFVSVVSRQEGTPTHNTHMKANFPLQYTSAASFVVTCCCWAQGVGHTDFITKFMQKDNSSDLYKALWQCFVTVSFRNKGKKKRKVGQSSLHTLN